MVTVNGGPVGPDGLGGSYKNTDSDDRAALWQSLGARQRLISGGTLTEVSGSLAVTMDAFRAAIAERDSAGNELDRGYHAWDDDQITIAFNPPSAQVRKDAVVLLVADTSAGEGAFGTDVTEAGPQVIPVAGTSGVTTPVPDADIQAAVGAGGWLRVGDVKINPGDTEIGAGNLVQAAEPGWVDFVPTLSGLALGNGSMVARFEQKEQTINWKVQIIWGSTTTADTTLKVGLPVQARSTTGRMPVGSASITDVSTSSRPLYLGVLCLNSPTDAIVLLNVNSALITPTDPMTWAVGDILSISGTYEAKAA